MKHEFEIKRLGILKRDSSEGQLYRGDDSEQCLSVGRPGVSVEV